MEISQTVALLNSIPDDTTFEIVLPTDENDASAEKIGQFEECEMCGFVYKKKKNLKLHWMKKHPDQELPSNLTSITSTLTLCIYPGCTKDFFHMKAMTEHLMRDHAVEVETKNLTFKSQQDFYNWKEKEDKGVCFMLQGGKHAGKEYNTMYYICHDGTARPHYRRDQIEAVLEQRAQKNKDMVMKRGVVCPARIICKVFHATGSVEVKYVSLHNHEIPINMIVAKKRPLPKWVKKAILTKAQLGIPIADIIREISGTENDSTDLVFQSMENKFPVTRKCVKAVIDKAIANNKFCVDDDESDDESGAYDVPQCEDPPRPFSPVKHVFVADPEALPIDSDGNSSDDDDDVVPPEELVQRTLKTLDQLRTFIDKRKVSSKRMLDEINNALTEFNRQCSWDHKSRNDGTIYSKVNSIHLSTVSNGSVAALQVGSVVPAFETKTSSVPCRPFKKVKRDHVLQRGPISAPLFTVTEPLALKK